VRKYTLKRVIVRAGDEETPQGGSPNETKIDGREVNAETSGEAEKNETDTMGPSETSTAVRTPAEQVLAVEKSDSSR